ncbi:hypothetical protein NIES4071_28040 [Calothrix sp. NIES-4071]|nr:hypothetical protein NIES4071_28040 [Calothrix sp. NIES-4071]BAZ57126.1 hypothetical protein NIES4105_27980 [Calothrix sp. NIES-4105]
MAISSTGKPTSPRQRRAKLKGEAAVDVENSQEPTTTSETNNSVEIEETKVLNKVELTKDKPVPESSNGKEKSSKLELREEKPSSLAVSGQRPIAASDLEIAETMTVSGVRPIGVSHLHVVDTMNIMGVRPIGANTIDVVDSMNLSGIRPIASSALVVSETYSVMGNRPVASNNIDDSEMIMGFLD